MMLKQEFKTDAPQPVQSGSEHGLKSEITPPAPYAGVPPFDPENYRKYVDDFDISEEQKLELLQTLWSIAVTFVDIGFGVDAMQLALPELAKFTEQIESPVDFSGAGESKDVMMNSHATNFNNAATDQVEKDE